MRAAASLGGSTLFSQTAEYALRAVAALAARSPDSMTTVELAQATAVPPSYLSKVLQALRKSGVVQSQRGVGGGVSLARDPAQLTLLEIVGAVDPIRRIRHCPLGIAAHGVRLCPLHARLDGALAMVEQVLTETTLAELLAEQNGRSRRCQFPKTLP